MASMLQTNRIVAIVAIQTKTQEAVRYLTLVEEVFKGTPEVYHEFRDVLAQYRDKS